jgi:hypothetical protein
MSSSEGGDKRGLPVGWIVIGCIVMSFLLMVILSMALT